MEILEYTARDGAKIYVRYFPYADPAPLVVDIHGGGFISGKASSDDRLCTDLSGCAGVNVASVEYRYAPGVTFPKSSEDCCDAMSAMTADPRLGFDRLRVFLMGHSVGANLAVAAAHDMPDVSGVILNYPYLAPVSFRRKYRLWSFTRLRLMRFERAYFPDPADRKSPLAFPVFMDGEEADAFPRTFILTCGLDTLRADGLKFYDILSSHGRDVTLMDLPRAEHGFLEIISDGRMVPRPGRNPDMFGNQEKYYGDWMDRAARFIRGL